MELTRLYHPHPHSRSTKRWLVGSVGDLFAAKSADTSLPAPRLILHSPTPPAVLDYIGPPTMQLHIKTWKGKVFTLAMASANAVNDAWLKIEDLE